MFGATFSLPRALALVGACVAAYVVATPCAAQERFAGAWTVRAWRAAPRPDSQFHFRDANVGFLALDDVVYTIARVRQSRAGAGPNSASCLPVASSASNRRAISGMTRVAFARCAGNTAT